MKSKKNQNIKVFEVPNNREGQSFIRHLKRYMNKGNYTVKLRGRHHDRVGTARRRGFTLNYNHDIPLKYAERIAVYLECKSNRKYNAKRSKELYNAKDTLATIKSLVNLEV